MFNNPKNEDNYFYIWLAGPSKKNATCRVRVVRISDRMNRKMRDPGNEVEQPFARGAENNIKMLLFIQASTCQVLLSNVL